MKQGKEIKPKETANQDPKAININANEFFNNRLSLSQELKSYMEAQSLDWRFLNKTEFHNSGNQHRAHWQPFNAKEAGLSGVTSPDGFVIRGDLILGVRTKEISKLHKQFLTERTRRQAQSANDRELAKDLRKMATAAGVGQDTKIHEGYEENE